MNLSGKQLSLIMPHCPHPDGYSAILTMETQTAHIDTVTASAAFLAMLAEESSELRVMEEQGDHGYLGANAKWYGRGWPQLTGLDNYQAAGVATGFDLVGRPELLLDPQVSGAVAAWFWTLGAGQNLSRAAKAHGLVPGCNLNDVANTPDFVGVCLAHNGGMNGFEQRRAYYLRALEVLGVGALV